jgi:hypothetical protein
MFLIDYAARLLRPVSIVWRLAQEGLKVIEDVYPDPIVSPRTSMPKLDARGPPERTILHRGTSAIVIAVNLKALIAAAERADCVIEFVPRVGDFVAVDDPLPAPRPSMKACCAGRSPSGRSAPSSRTRRSRFASS